MIEYDPSVFKVEPGDIRIVKIPPATLAEVEEIRQGAGGNSGSKPTAHVAPPNLGGSTPGSVDYFVAIRRRPKMGPGGQNPWAEY